MTKFSPAPGRRAGEDNNAQALPEAPKVVISRRQLLVVAHGELVERVGVG
jgi:hypothetical protein